SDYEEWFAAFFEDTKDSGRREQWQKDAHLKGVLAVRDKVKPARHDPRQIAKRPDASYQELAITPPDEARSQEGPEKTKEALGAIAAIESSFQPRKWKTLEDVAALSEEWQRREWRKPAAHLKSLVEAMKPGPKLVAAVDEILAFEEQTRKEIESRWEGIKSDQDVIEGSSDELLKKFGEFLTDETKSAPGQGTRNDVEALRRKLNELEKLSKDAAAFVRGPWKDKVDQQWFKKEVSDRLSQAGRPLTAQLLRETWLANDAVVKGFYRLDEDPRDSWALDIDDAKDLREKLEKRHAKRTVTEQEYTRLLNQLDRLNEAITAVRSLPAFAIKKPEIEEGMRKAEEAYALVHPQILEREEFRFQAFFDKLAASFPDRAAFRKHFRNPGDADALRGRGIPGSTPHSLDLLSPKGLAIRPKREDENGNLVFDVFFTAHFEVTEGFIRGKTYTDPVSQEWTITPGPAPDQGEIIKVEPRPVPTDAR
ncbi:hypothetical protein HQ563_13415, partial [bacterium]|nr:hypothetical protein [bacterium]